MSFLSLAQTKKNETLKAFDLVFQIRGYDFYFASSELVDIIRVGDEGLFVDGTWLIGGLRRLENQPDEPLLSLDDSTTTIASSVAPDEAVGTSVEFMKIGLIDKDGLVSKLISPGIELDDVLGLDIKLWIGFQDTLFSSDYLPVFRGIISGVTASSGIIYFDLSSSEEKKRAELFLEYESELSSAIDSSETTIPVLSTNDLLIPIEGPSGDVDESFETYITIDDEIMQVLSITSTTITVERGSKSSVATAHDNGSSLNNLYIIKGNPILIALKLMLSRAGDYYFEISNSNIGLTVDGVFNGALISFVNRNLILEENIQAGDFVTITGSASGNDITLLEILSITESIEGTEIVLTTSPFSAELNSEALIRFRSKYDVYPTKLALNNDDVDIKKHENYFRSFFPSTIFEFFIRDESTGKDFLDNELYKPCAVYSLSKEGRSSVGYHFPPLPTANIQVISSENVKNAPDLSVRRTIAKNFYNSIIYKYEDSITDTDFSRTVINIDAESVSRIRVGNRALVIESRGMKDAYAGESFANSQSVRRLNRYKFAAEEIEGVQVFISSALLSSLGDAVVLDGGGLKLLNSLDGSRNFTPRYMEVTEKRINILNGSAEVTLLDTGFGLDNNFFLMSPYSRVLTAFEKTITISGSGITPSGISEWTKWKKYEGYNIFIRIRFDRYYGATEANENLNIAGVFPVITEIESVGEDNTITVKDSLPGMVTGSFLSNGLIIELAPYSDQAGINREVLMTVFGWMNETDFSDRKQYQMI